jgi:hypothetical protein
MALQACVECGYLTTFVTVCPQCGRKPRVLIGLRTAGITALVLMASLAVHYFAKADQVQSSALLATLRHE